MSMDDLGSFWPFTHHGVYTTFLSLSSVEFCTAWAVRDVPQQEAGLCPNEAHLGLSPCSQHGTTTSPKGGIPPCEFSPKEKEICLQNKS